MPLKVPTTPSVYVVVDENRHLISMCSHVTVQLENDEQASTTLYSADKKMRTRRICEVPRSGMRDYNKRCTGDRNRNRTGGGLRPSPAGNSRSGLSRSARRPQVNVATGPTPSLSLPHLFMSQSWADMRRDDHSIWAYVGGPRVPTNTQKQYGPSISRACVFRKPIHRCLEGRQVVPGN